MVESPFVQILFKIAFEKVLNVFAETSDDDWELRTKREGVIRVLLFFLVSSLLLSVVVYPNCVHCSSLYVQGATGTLPCVTTRISLISF